LITVCGWLVVVAYVPGRGPAFGTCLSLIPLILPRNSLSSKRSTALFPPGRAVPSRWS